MATRGPQQARGEAAVQARMETAARTASKSDRRSPVAAMPSVSVGVVAGPAADERDPERRCVWVQSQCPMSEHDLTMIFFHFGHVEHVDVPRARSGHLPFAFVHFQQEEDDQSTVRRADDGEFVCLTVKPYVQSRRDAWQPVQRSSNRWMRDQ